MKASRTLRMKIYARPVNMGGFPVRQPLPAEGIDQIDPFLLLHHALVKVPVYKKTSEAGVGPHPHRGFAAVTLIYKGGVHHRDSRGNDSVVYSGGTQWMYAGRGIIHSERPPEDIIERGGVQEIIQLWINVPSANKMDQPAYIPLSDEDTPEISFDGGKIGVVAGDLEGIRGKIPLKSDLMVMRLEMREQSEYFMNVPGDFHCCVYLLDGEMSVGGETVTGHHLAFMNKDGEGVSLKAGKDTRALVLAGLPIGEPVVSYGPFVMNTQTEILQAMKDYQMGKMGILIEE